MSWRSRRFWRRVHRRRQKRLIPAEATAISARTRFRDYPITKSITRRHHRKDKRNYWAEEL